MAFDPRQYLGDLWQQPNPHLIINWHQTNLWTPFNHCLDQVEGFIWTFNSTPLHPTPLHSAPPHSTTWSGTERISLDVDVQGVSNVKQIYFMHFVAHMPFIWCSVPYIIKSWSVACTMVLVLVNNARYLNLSWYLLGPSGTPQYLWLLISGFCHQMLNQANSILRTTEGFLWTFKSTPTHSTPPHNWETGFWQFECPPPLMFSVNLEEQGPLAKVPTNS